MRSFARYRAYLEIRAEREAFQIAAQWACDETAPPATSDSVHEVVR